MPSLFEIAQTIRQPEELTSGVRGRANRASQPIVAGLVPPEHVVLMRKLDEGISELAPEELLALNVPLLQVGNEIVGYQRRHPAAHIRKIAHAMHEEYPFPAATVCIGEDFAANITDGVGRALGAVMARKDLRVDVRFMSLARQAKLFAGQGKGSPIERSQTALNADDPISLYVQDVFTAPATPWEGLIAWEPKRARHLSPSALAGIVAIYAGGAAHTLPSAEQERRFTPEAANELALLLRAFGTPQTNPLAFAPLATRAITMAALMAVARQGRRAEDIRHWHKRMPRFPFAEYPHIRSAVELRGQLILHWNKGLPPEKKISVT